MTRLVLDHMTASISELQNNPMKTIQEGRGQPIAILNGNETAFYCVPPDIYGKLVEMVEDQELTTIADDRMSDGQDPVKVSLSDL